MFTFAKMRRSGLVVLLFSLCLIATLLFTNKATFAQSPVVSPEKPSLSVTENVRKTELENGLTVLTKEVHTAPVVTVQVWYKVGSRNEAPGVNGIAHQLEHMMFKGTKERPIQFGRLFNALGSDSNAFTSYDQTAYFGTVERNKLKAMLTLEADRMQNAVIAPERLASEKRVVISELQGYENNPEYRLSRAVMRAAFPDQPYGLPVGGTKADVQKFTADRVQEYYRKYYSPNNATLILVGDFQTEPTLATIKETFGKVPKSGVGSQEGVSSNEPQTTDNRQQTTNKQPIVLKQQGSAPLLEVVYPLPNAIDPDVPALDVMDFIFTEGRSSRIYQALVESGLASDAGGGTANMIAGGWYSLEATAAPGQKLETIDAAMQKAIAALQNQGVTEEELNRAKAQLRSQLILTNRDITSQAMQLGFNQTTAGDYRYTDRYLAAVNQVSTADVQRVAKKYLAPDLRTAGLFEPTQIKPAQAGAEGSTQTTESFNAGPPVDPATVAKYLPPVDLKTTPTTQTLPEQFSLSNNLLVLLLPDQSTPTVTLSGYIRAGSEFDSENQAGLATLTAANVMNGTKSKDALTLAKTLEDRGASLSFDASREGVNIAGHSLATDMPTLVQTLADVLQNANFPPNELELARQRALTELKVVMDNPGQVARRTFQKAVYPTNHPFHTFPTSDSLKRIQRENVVSFYQSHYRPELTILTLAGDFEPKAVRSLLEKQLADWKASSKPPTVNYPQVPLPKKVVQLNPVIPGKTQSVTFMGYRGIDRKDPRYYSAEVLNEIVGGNTLSSRLGTQIRDRLGLTYGIYSAFVTGRHAGPFMVQMQTSPEDAGRAIANTRNLLEEIHKQGVSDAELNTAKRSITSSYTISLANPDELASTILMNAVYGLGEEELRAFPKKVESVTLKQVNQDAKQLLQPSNLVIVTAGPGQAIEQGKK